MVSELCCSSALTLIGSGKTHFGDSSIWSSVIKGIWYPPMYDAHGPVSAPIFDKNSKNFEIVSAILSGD